MEEQPGPGIAGDPRASAKAGPDHKQAALPARNTIAILRSETHQKEKKKTCILHESRAIKATGSHSIHVRSAFAFSATHYNSLLVLI